MFYLVIFNLFLKILLLYEKVLNGKLFLLFLMRKIVMSFILIYIFKERNILIEYYKLVYIKNINLKVYIDCILIIK